MIELDLNSFCSPKYTRPSKRDVKRSTFGGHAGETSRAAISRRCGAAVQRKASEPCEVGGRSSERAVQEGGGRNPAPAVFRRRGAGCRGFLPWCPPPRGS